MRIAGLALLALLPIPAMLAATCTGKVDSVDTVDGKQTIQLSPRKPNTALSAECKPKLVALPGIAIEKLDPDDAVALDVDAKAGVTRLAVVCSGKIKGTSTGQPANAQKRVELSPSTPSVKLSRACGETLDVPKAKWDEHVGDGDSIELEVEANSQVKKPVLVKQITIPAQGVVQSADPVTGVVAIGDARVDKTFDNKKELVPGLGQPSELIRVSLRDASTKDSLKDFAKGDRVSLRFVFEPDSTPTTSLERIQIRTLAAEGIGPWTKFLLLGGSAGFLCLVAAFLSKWNAIEMFFIGVDQDASKSKTQGALWLVLVLAVFLAVFILRLWYGDWLFGSIAMPTNLALLAGISGISLVGAKAIRVSQEPPTRRH